MTPKHPLASTAARRDDAFVNGWQRWDAASLVQACEAASGESQEPQTRPELAYWRGLADFMVEGADALTWLDRA